MPNSNSSRVDEPIFFYEWNGSGHDQFDGVIRVVLDEHRNGTQHLRITDPSEPSGFRNVNNVASEESWDDTADMDGSDGWERADEAWDRPA